MINQETRTMARRGTTAKIELEELEKLYAMQCTDEEIAGWFGVSTRTIERRRKIRKFAEAMERGKARGRISVRRLQMKLLEEGNATMGIWLGKQILGQVDEVRHSGDALVQTAVIVMPRGRNPKLPEVGRPVIGVSPEEAIDAAAESVSLDGQRQLPPRRRTDP
jgi:hypothetical protein